MPTIQLYKKMLAYLIDNGKAKDYADIARKSGITESQISRVRHNHVKSVSEAKFHEVNNAYGRIFNPDWWRGDSDIMLVAELETVAQKDGATCMPQAAPPDMSSMINAIIAANDQTIMSLRRELAGKDETIAGRDALVSTLQQHVSDLRQQNDDLRQQVADLRKALAAAQSKDVLKEYPFSLGAAEDDQRAQGSLQPSRV